ncbi:hypothetical protein WI27_27145 [Burkholderia cepacia]|nr:hypothetical protein WI27_27145 [Burkholderia cepacia]
MDSIAICVHLQQVITERAAALQACRRFGTGGAFLFIVGTENFSNEVDSILSVEMERNGFKR